MQFLRSFHHKTAEYLWRNVLQTLQRTVQQSCDFLPAIRIISLDSGRDGYRIIFPQALLKSLSGVEDPQQTFPLIDFAKVWGSWFALLSLKSTPFPFFLLWSLSECDSTIICFDYTTPCLT